MQNAVRKRLLLPFEPDFTNFAVAGRLCSPSQPNLSCEGVS